MMNALMVVEASDADVGWSTAMHTANQNFALSMAEKHPMSWSQHWSGEDWEFNIEPRICGGGCATNVGRPHWWIWAEWLNLRTTAKRIISWIPSCLAFLKSPFSLGFFIWLKLERIELTLPLLPATFCQASCIRDFQMLAQALVG